MLATLEKPATDKLESLFKSPAPPPQAPPRPLFVSGLSAPVGRKIIGKMPRGSTSNPPSNIPVNPPQAAQEGKEAMPAPKRQGPKATKEGLEIREFFEKQHKAGKPLPTYKEYCRLSGSKVNGALYNTAKGNFMKRNGMSSKRQVTAVLPSVHAATVKKVIILSTIPGPIPAGAKELLAKVFADAAKNRGITFGPLSFVKTTDPEALEVREEVT